MFCVLDNHIDYLVSFIKNEFHNETFTLSVLHGKNRLILENKLKAIYGTYYLISTTYASNFDCYGNMPSENAINITNEFRARILKDRDEIDNLLQSSNLKDSAKKNLLGHRTKLLNSIDKFIQKIEANKII